MGFQKIDYAAWPRRPYFEHYHRDVPCWYSMTVDVDISALLPRLRGSGLRFYPSVIHGISRMVNADPAGGRYPRRKANTGCVGPEPGLPAAV